MRYVENFFKDLRHAQVAEQRVCQVLSSTVPTYVFRLVSDQPEYYHRGDIRAFGMCGDEHFIEVKADSRIAQTGNVLCEEAVYYNNTDEEKPGNMYSDYDIYAIVSEQNKQIYFIDFSWLREHYKKGRYKVIPHSDQTTYCYLLPLSFVKANGALLGVLEY